MTGSVPVMEILIAQYLVIMILAPALIGRARLARVHRLPQLRLLLTRSVCQIGASVAFVWAVKSLPLADVVTIGFMSPFIITVLAAIFPKETGCMARWVGCIVCFVGVMVILRPGFHIEFGLALLPLAYAFLFAIHVVIARFTSTVHGEQTLLAMNRLVCGPIAMLLIPFMGVMPDLSGIKILIVIALVNAGAQHLIICAYALAPASLLAPFQYLEIIGAGAVGFLLFSQLPDLWAWIGIGIIITTNIAVPLWEACSGHAHGHQVLP